ncbi:MAG TPA: type VII secretion protein EssA [Chondromyces sp.]|nr:type VII secretion protein EssA [Chondromyces sp.]
MWLLLIFLISIRGAEVYAAENPEVEPHLYEEQEIDIKMDYFHEETLLQKKEDLPEEQKGLTFESPKSNPFYENVEKQLFSSEKEKNAIETTTERLKLFQEKGEKQATVTEESTGSTNGQPYWLIITLILLAAFAIFYMFFILIPKINKISSS